MKTITVIGTRPEAIKMAPIIKEMDLYSEIKNIVCLTGQHGQMLDQILNLFKIRPDYNLNIFKDGQSLTDITIASIKGLEAIIKKEKPHILLVQGDTSTVFAGALAGFYQGIKIGHVEAGLRTGNIYSPYPEEANRKLTGIISNFHFVPTQTNRRNLLNEGYDDGNIYVTGNTVIDSLRYSVKDKYIFDKDLLNGVEYDLERVILLTSHRRENIGRPMENIFKAINDITNLFDDVRVIFPLHPNPKVRDIAKAFMGRNSKIHLIEPLDYEPFTNLMARCHLVVTDSGGIQEEAPSLGKPVLVVRKETERPEGVQSGTARLVGTSYESIFKNLEILLRDNNQYDSMAKSINPYGDGKAGERIVKILLKIFKENITL